MDSQGERESLEPGVLKRITVLEESLGSQPTLSNASNHGVNSRGGGNDGDSAESMESRLSIILRTMGVSDFIFRRVTFDYYNKSLEERKEILGAYSAHHICKSIVMVNTQAPSNVTDCSDHKNSKYYIVVVQYIARLNAESIKKFLYAINNKKIPKKRFNFVRPYKCELVHFVRLAPEEESLKLTGFEHNAVTCVGMKTNIPVILDEAIVKLEPDFFWLGGGEVDLKLGIRTQQFINAINPILVSCSS